MSYQGKEDDRSLLADAPAAVFVLVAGADGKVDAKERTRYEQMLEAASTAPDDALAEVLQAAKSALERIDELDPTHARSLLERVPAAAKASFDAQTSVRFCHGLLQMGQRIASASGGGVLGLGSRTAQSEQATLREL
jgi:tellurite resistance protein